MKHKGVIWTKHILQRMKERGLSYDDVYWVFRSPDKSHYAKAKGAWKFYRVHKGMRLALVATKNDEGEWVFMTCWWKDLQDVTRKSSGGKKGLFAGLWRDVWKMIWGR